MMATLGALEAITAAEDLQSMNIHDRMNLASSDLCNRINTSPTNLRRVAGKQIESLSW